MFTTIVMIDTTKLQCHTSCNLSNQRLAITSTQLEVASQSFPASVELRTRANTNLSWCPSLPCHTVAMAKKEWMGPLIIYLFIFASKEGTVYFFPLFLLTIECTSIVFLLKKWLSIWECLSSVITHVSKAQIGNGECSYAQLLLQGQIKTSDVPLFKIQRNSGRSLF